ncbi:M20/M25/M40 family metallo-hydrolase [Bacteroidota bacterium]
MKYNSFLIMFFLLSIIFPNVYAQQLNNNLEIGFKSIKPMEVYNYCKKIASDEFAGRLTGHDGYTKAADWAADKFNKWRLKPINENDGYLQPYSSPYTVIESAELKFHIIQDDGTFEDTTLTPLDDFLPILFSGSGSNTSGVVFVGWGISAPSLGYDDYAGVDVNGKYVVCFRGQPVRGDTAFFHHDHHRTRMEIAKSKGALGLFYIYPTANANPNGEYLPDFTPAIITEDIADLLLKEKGTNSKELKKSITGILEPNSFELSSKISYSVSADNHPEGIGYNIVGYVEGNDPALQDECIVIGGHFDHCGEHMGIIFPGANDNASGSAVVMEIAEAFSKLNEAPKRSVVFVLFGGEEMGLEGSDYFADHLPSQFTKIDAMFNHDMNGEGEGTRYGYTAHEGFNDNIIEADKLVNTLRGSREIKQVGVRSSDYAPFFRKGAACAAFFSNGPHLHYHLPGDTIYRINPDILADIAKLSFIAAYNWSNR